MKIISRGTPPKEIIKQCTCPECKTVFEYSQDEVQVEEISGTWIGTWRPQRRFISCPVCYKKLEA